MHKLSDLLAKLTVTRRGKGEDVYYEAECPICFYVHSVDVLSSEDSAKLLARQHIVAHLKTQHAQEIE